MPQDIAQKDHTQSGGKLGPRVRCVMSQGVMDGKSGRESIAHDKWAQMGAIHEVRAVLRLVG